MRIASLFYTPLAFVDFTNEEVEQLAKCARQHYDPVCRKSVEPGYLVGGMLGAIEDGFQAIASLDRDKMQLLCKIMEAEPMGHPLRAALLELLRKAPVEIRQ